MNNNHEKPDNSPDPFWLEHRDRQNRTHFRRRPSWRERRREQAILDWFGPDLGRNEIQARQQPAAPLGQSLDNLMRELGKGRQVILEQIKDHWADISGSEIARQTRPMRLYQNCLEVEVSHSMWLYELQTRRKPQLVERLAEFSKGQVKDIRFVPAGRHR